MNEIEVYKKFYYYSTDVDRDELLYNCPQILRLHKKYFNYFNDELHKLRKIVKKYTKFAKKYGYSNPDEFLYDNIIQFLKYWYNLNTNDDDEILYYYFGRMNEAEYSPSYYFNELLIKKYVNSDEEVYRIIRKKIIDNYHIFIRDIANYLVCLYWIYVYRTILENLDTSINVCRIVLGDDKVNEMIENIKNE